jgi:hypothetical protein
MESSSSTRRIVEELGIGAFGRARGRRRAYYSPAMEAARLRTRGRRLRRGTVERPLNARLVRVGFVVVIPACIALLFSISTTSALPRPPLDPLFDGASAASYAGDLATEYPSRIPGSEGAEGAAHWYSETVSSIGLETEDDTWTERIAGLGQVQLRNVVSVVPGRSDETIVLVAHRDNAGADEPLGENASGTATLIELARGFAPQDAGPDPLPNRTLVLVSTDAGAWGGAGAGRFVATSPLARAAVAVIVLDDLGRGHPRLAIAGDDPVSPARTLVRTAAARVTEEVGVAPTLPSLASQLVDLGIPFAFDEQGRFLKGGLSAITLTTEGSHSTSSIVDPMPEVDRLGRLGRAVETLVGSLDLSAGASFRTPDSLFFSDRAASGWTLRLALILSVVPFALGLVDLVVRGRRRRLPFAGALRAQRARLGFWAYAAVLVWLGALFDVFPTGAPLPLPPYANIFEHRPVLGILVLGAALVAGWLIVRGRLEAASQVSPEERLAGHAVALSVLAIVALALAFVQPYALVFVLPSVYAWLWLPLEARLMSRVAFFAVGLVVPIVALVLLGSQLSLSVLDAALYVVTLVTVGYVPLVSALIGLTWVAATTQVGALAFGRYGPYAAGLEPPPQGPIRRALRRAR